MRITLSVAKEFLVKYDRPRIPTWAASWRWVSDPEGTEEKMVNPGEPGLIDGEPTRDLIKVVRHHHGTRISIPKCQFSSKTRGERPDLRPVAHEGARGCSLFLTAPRYERAPSSENPDFHCIFKSSRNGSPGVHGHSGRPYGPETIATTTPDLPCDLQRPVEMGAYPGWRVSVTVYCGRYPKQGNL